MAIQGIDNVLQQLQTTAAQAGGVKQTDDLSGGNFANELKTAIDKISDTQQTARQQAQQFVLGSTENGLNDVMVELQKSSVSLQLGVQVRNKLVAAYQDVMNMPV